jgi:undecaprenyl-diphosphatase
MGGFEQWDRLLTLWVNQPAGKSPLLDKIVADIADSELLKGGIYLALYWWLWFDRRTKRRNVVVALVAAVATVIVSRGMQFFLPFHQRPILNPDLGLHVPLSVRPETYNVFSSFPSDTGALFFALSFPLWARSWPLGAAAMLWAFFVVCVPRVYLGIHYVSDVLAGIVLGIGFMAIACPLLARTRLPDLVVKFEAAHPAIFYGLAFTASLELATLFFDLRQLGLDAVNLAKMLKG